MAACNKRANLTLAEEWHAWSTSRGVDFLIAFVFTPSAAIGQTAADTATATKYEPPRTPWGQPDLQGIWNNVTATPLQRPAEYKDKAFLTPQEAAEFAARAAQREADGESRPTAQQTPGQRTGYASSIWFETTHSLSDRRTSLLVDQEDGKLPALTPEGQKIAQALAEAPSSGLLTTRRIAAPTNAASRAGLPAR
jgi:hypothetical protein